MMTQFQMEFMASERIREAHEAAAVRSALRSSGPTRPGAIAWRTRIADRLARVTLRWAAAR